MINVKGLKEITEIPIAALDELLLFDIAILRHGFEKYNRDYFFILHTETEKQKGFFKIVFTHCFDLCYRHKFADIKAPDLLRRSWDDCLISPDFVETEATKHAYWWGQNRIDTYPGFFYDIDSLKAQEMTEITGRQMYAVVLETSHYFISFIFHDFKYEFLGSE